ncbi:MAG: TonB-dependent receptor, partial [Bacteroidota bacterium]|nr:TonB-dependent receptor [Bacteroidota bacterium]
ENDFSKWIDSSTITNDTASYLQVLKSKTKDVSEASLTSLLNFEIPFSIGNDLAVSVKFGGKYNQLDRESFYTEHREQLYDLGLGNVDSWDPEYPYDYYVGNDKLLLKTFTDPNYSVEDIIGGEYMFDNPISEEKTDNFHDYFGDLIHYDKRATKNNLDLRETILAGYLMTKVKYKDYLTVIAGVRVEKSDNSYASFISSISGTYGQFGEMIDTTTYQNYTDFLPHLHIKFEPLKWYTLRLSAAKTLARPNYNYISYSASVVDMYKSISTGNPDLKHMTSMNYDLSMSFYDGKYGLLTVGGFYKDIKNIFYRNAGVYFHNDSVAAAYGWPGKALYRFSSYTNSPETTVYGFEVDLQTSLKFLPAPFKGVVLSANFTRLYSSNIHHTNELITTDSLVGDPMTGFYFFQYSEPREREITMPGQVPYILNLSVGYDYKGFSCRVSANSQGQYLISPGSHFEGLYDNVRLKFWRWDFAIKQQITKNIEIYFNANNFNNMKEVTYYNDQVDILKSKLSTGTVLSYGLRLEF